MRVPPTLLLLLLITSPLRAQLPEKLVVRPEGRAAAPWSPAVLVGNTLYLAGHGTDGARPAR